MQKFGGCERESTFVSGEDTDNEELSDAEEGGETESRRGEKELVLQCQ